MAQLILQISDHLKSRLLHEAQISGQNLEEIASSLLETELDIVSDIRLSLEQFDAGQGQDAKSAIEQIAQKYNVQLERIPDPSTNSEQ